MNRKTIGILLGILGVLVLGVILKGFWKPAEFSAEIFSPLSFSFEPAQVSGLEMQLPRKAGETPSRILLKREEACWRIQSLTGSRADEGKIKKVLEAIRNFRGELRTADPNLLQDFGLDESRALQIRLLNANANPVLVFFAGVRSSSGGGAFVRKQDSNEIFWIPEDFREFGVFRKNGKIVLEDSFWVDPKFFRLSPEKVERIRIHTPQKNVEAVMQTPLSPEWAAYLNTVKEISAVQLLFGEKELARMKEPGSYLLEIQRKGEVPLVLDAGYKLDLKGDGFGAQIRGVQPAFVISKQDFKVLFEDLDGK